MAITIGSNILSLKAQRSLASATDNVSKAFERLSSGQRINRASDDAAGLAISSSLNFDTRIYSQALRNVSDGISALSIASGALGQLEAITTRQLELAEQAANGTYSYKQRKALDTEAAALTAEYNRILDTTTFNGIRLFDLDQNLSIQVGRGSNAILDVSIGDKLARAIGDGTFTYSGTYGRVDTGGETKSLVLADIDGDGVDELITAGSEYGIPSSGATFVYQNNGDGTFALSRSYPTDADGVNAGMSTSVSAGDINGDGYLDLVVGGYVSSATQYGWIDVLLNDGTGSFTIARSYAPRAGAPNCSTGSVSLTDLNGDGAADMVAMGNETGSGWTAVYMNDGHGSFTSTEIFLPPTGNASINFGMSTGDVNGDGAQDIAVTTTVAILGGYTYIYLNNGDGTFAYSRSYAFDGDQARAGALGDVNGDGRADMITAGFTAGAWITPRLAVRLANPDGTFSAATTFTAISPTADTLIRSLAAEDLNGDGAADIVASGYVDAARDTGLTLVYLSNGNGTFAFSRSYASQDNGVTQGQSNSVAVGDINGDDVPDLAVGGYQYQGIYTYSATTVYTANVTDRTCKVLEYDLTTQQTARHALTAYQSQLSRITGELGSIGAYMSRLDVAARVLSTTRENYQSASSRITDADMAETAAELVRSQVLQQTASRVLSLANVGPRLVLDLLKG